MAGSEYVIQSQLFTSWNTILEKKHRKNNKSLKGEKAEYWIELITRQNWKLNFVNKYDAGDFYIVP